MTVDSVFRAFSHKTINRCVTVTVIVGTTVIVSVRDSMGGACCDRREFDTLK
jgi:hypothetical protein